MSTPKKATAEVEKKKNLSMAQILPQPGEIIRIPIRSRDGDDPVVGYARFKPMTPGALRRYRTIYSGGVGGKKLKPAEANQYLIDQCFLGFENIDVPFEEGGFQSEAEWFAYSEQGQLLAEFVLGRFLVVSSPDTDDIKE